jgi:hypothetical protein
MMMFWRPGGDSNRLSVKHQFVDQCVKFTASGHTYVEIRQRRRKIAMISMVDSKVELNFVRIPASVFRLRNRRSVQTIQPIQGTHKLASLVLAWDWRYVKNWFN